MQSGSFRRSRIQILASRRAGQQASMSVLKGAALADSLEITEVPYVDSEVTGVYGLRFFADLAHPPKARTATNPIDSRKLTIFGGKGGVGKYYRGIVGSETQRFWNENPGGQH